VTDLSPDAALPPNARLRYFSPWLVAVAAAWVVVYAVVAPEPLRLLQRNFYLVPVGLFGAIVGNVTAVGGGLVFIPIMIFLVHLDPVQALKLAILSQAFGMTSGAIGWARRGVLPRKLLLIALPGLLVGSTISTLVIRPSAILVKGVFGPVSIAIGLLTLVLLGRSGTRDNLPKSATLPLILASCIGGLITGWVAIGEGEIVAASMMLGFGLSADRGIALGVALLSINSIYLSILHQAFMGGLPWSMAAFTAFGCIFGARLGPYFTQWISHKTLKVLFAIVAVSDGILFVVQFVLHARK
jgi:uncharacterized membrane protein YfcA